MSETKVTPTPEAAHDVRAEDLYIMLLPVLHKGIVASYISTVDNRSDRIVELEHQVRRLTDELNMIKRSTSWRLTRALRHFGERVKRIGHGEDGSAA